MKRKLKPTNINSHNHKIKLVKKIFYSIGLSSLLVVPSTLVFTSTLNSQFIQSNSLKNNKRFDDNLSVTIDNPDASAFQNQVKPLVPIEYNTFMPLISTPWGPVGFWKNEIRALDWFGAIRWTLDTTSFAPTNHTISVDRAFINWAYDFSKNEIWLLSNGTANVKQKFVRVSGETGNVIGTPIELAKNPKTIYQMYYFIQVLANGNVMAYGNGSTWDKQFDILDVEKNIVTTKKSSVPDSAIQNLASDSTTSNTEIRLKNIIPIASNYNILVFQRYKAGPTNMNVGFLLVDDNQNLVISENSNKWSKLVNLYNNPKGPINRLSANKAYYKLLDGRVITVAFDQLIVFDGSKKTTDYGFYKTFDLNNLVTSFSFDSSENLYFTAKGQTKIFKLIPPKINSNLTNLVIDTYYDLNGSSILQIKNNASNFILYNVYNYSGQIMLIKPYMLLNPKDTNQSDGIGWPDQATIDSQMYGLAAAITNSVSSLGSGDSKGLLNTKDAFQFSADFDIDKSVLDKKLPSEITEKDLTLLNQSFLTKNVAKNDNNTLKYPPFIKSNINDQTGKFTIQVYLDQIPWFTDKLPTNWIPLKITKTFDTINKISSRVKWKSVDEDYDFKNTLPTKVDNNDLNRFNPFLIDLVSQKVINGETQLYPKKDYKVTKSDDTTGEITIECTYTYMPLGVPIAETNALTFTTSNNFTIFKKSEPKKFEWNTDGTTNTTTSIISNIPSLKKFTEANVLPSSIQANNKTQLLDFIDLNQSKGYPISKMTVQSTPNDRQGTLNLNLTLPKGYYDTVETFNHTYTKLNKIGDYSFTYKTPESLNKVSSTTLTNYSKILPSQVTEEQVFMDFINYSGYDGLDLLTTLLPNDANGTLTVRVELTNNYPISVASISPFQLISGKYIASQTFSNFLTQEKFQQQYVVNFKNNNDKTLAEIKNLQVSAILNAISSSGNGLTIGNQKYQSKKDLVELFIKSKGVNIPSIEDSNVTIYGDDQSGILTFELLFKETQTGLNYPLSFTQTFTGFLQGVAVPTSDIFIFKNQDNLTGSILSKLPSEISQELKNNPIKIKDYFVSTLAGQFEQLIQNPSNYTITTYPNDLTGTLGITIKFNGVTNNQTLTLYSKMYSGFKIVS